MLECFEALKSDGSTENVNRKLSFEGFKEIIKVDEHLELEKKFGL
jgi:methylisocitrate lyase